MKNLVKIANLANGGFYDNKANSFLVVISGLTPSSNGALELLDITHAQVWGSVAVLFSTQSFSGGGSPTSVNFTGNVPFFATMPKFLVPPNMTIYNNTGSAVNLVAIECATLDEASELLH